jgi:hypothetical protein
VIHCPWRHRLRRPTFESPPPLSRRNLLVRRTVTERALTSLCCRKRFRTAIAVKIKNSWQCRMKTSLAPEYTPRERGQGSPTCACPVAGSVGHSQGELSLPAGRDGPCSTSAPARGAMKAAGRTATGIACVPPHTTIVCLARALLAPRHRGGSVVRWNGRTAVRLDHASEERRGRSTVRARDRFRQRTGPPLIAPEHLHCGGFIAGFAVKGTEAVSPVPPPATAVCRASPGR